MTDKLESRSGIRVDRIRMLREKNGWSKRELARLCKLSETMVGKYESGEVDPTATSLKSISDQLKVSVDYLLGLTDDPTLHIREPGLDDNERTLLEIYRREGWAGVIHLGADKLSK